MILDFTLFRSIIENKLANELTIVPVLFENAHGKLENDEHIEVSFQGADSVALEIGSNIEQKFGFMTIQIFTRIGIGTDRARSIAAQAAKIIEDWENPNVSLSNPVLSSVGEVSGKHLYEHQLTFLSQYFYGQEENTNNC